VRRLVSAVHVVISFAYLFARVRYRLATDVLSIRPARFRKHHPRSPSTDTVTPLVINYNNQPCSRVDDSTLSSSAASVRSRVKPVFGSAAILTVVQTLASRIRIVVDRL